MISEEIEELENKLSESESTNIILARNNKQLENLIALLQSRVSLLENENKNLKKQNESLRSQT